MIPDDVRSLRPMYRPTVPLGPPAFPDGLLRFESTMGSARS